MNKLNLIQPLKTYLLTIKQWYLETPERSLDEAYKAALLIKTIEEKHFNGKKIEAESASYGDTVMAYFQSELKKYLKTTRMRLAEFHGSRLVVNNYNSTITTIVKYTPKNSDQDSFAIQSRNYHDLILEKLKFIEQVLTKYKYREQLSLFTNTQISQTETNKIIVNQPNTPINNLEKTKVTKAKETRVAPRAILNTLNRFGFEGNPKSEQELAKNIRFSQRKTAIAVQIMVLLIIVPLLTYYLSKQFIVGPLVDKFISSNTPMVFLNDEMQERALIEMQTFEEKIKFDNLMGSVAEISSESMSNQMRQKVHEIAQKFKAESSNAIKNIFADILSVGAFS